MTKVAIVEDDIAIVQMYRMKFESEDMEVETASDGKEGLQLLSSYRPDVLLLDVMMPEMNGDEMLEELRKKPYGKNLQVIVLTNMGESEGKEKFQELGVDDFIVKAEMTPKQVADRVKELVGEDGEEE